MLYSLLLTEKDFLPSQQIHLSMFLKRILGILFLNLFNYRISKYSKTFNMKIK